MRSFQKINLDRDGRRPLVCFVVNVDWFFLSHRLPLALAARDRGADVMVIAGDSGRSDNIRETGLAFLPMPLSRKGINPLAEMHSLLFLLRAYRRYHPALVHHITIKPVIYGSIASRITGQIAVVNTISGLGYAFSQDGFARILEPFVQIMYRVALGHRKSRTIFQNPDDRRAFVSRGLLPSERAVLIRGSGIDCSKFKPRGEPTDPAIVVLPSRMLWDKGVEVFVNAARILRQRNPGTRFVLVGAPDEGNPRSVPLPILQDWAKEGIVEWWGHREDMPEVLARAQIVVLPTTHREGLPKVLLEAAASGRPIVASDVPGCRDIVRTNVNGFLTAPRDSSALSHAIQTLLDSPELREKFGHAGREIAEDEFAERIVIDQTLSLYCELLNERG